MKNLKKYLFVLLGVFLSGVITPSIIFAEEVTVPSQTFDLGAVQGVWDQTAQTLTVQGNGKIDFFKWRNLKSTLDLQNIALSKIEFKSGVQFPDDASKFFWNVKTSNIVFPDGMDTSNVVNMYLMFFDTDFDWTNIGNWDVSKVVNF